MNKPLLEYSISARRIDGHEGEALCKNAPILKFRLEGVEIRIEGRRRDDPPKMISI